MWTIMVLMLLAVVSKKEWTSIRGAKVQHEVGEVNTSFDQQNLDSLEGGKFQ
jgi:hypothetical protein